MTYQSFPKSLKPKLSTLEQKSKGFNTTLNLIEIQKKRKKEEKYERSVSSKKSNLEKNFQNEFEQKGGIPSQVKERVIPQRPSLNQPDSDLECRINSEFQADAFQVTPSCSNSFRFEASTAESMSLHCISSNKKTIKIQPQATFENSLSMASQTRDFREIQSSYPSIAIKSQ